MRAVARMPHPSTRADTIWTRFGVLSTFAILDIMRERVGKVKRFVVASFILLNGQALDSHQPIG
jgi:hypothetical protein